MQQETIIHWADVIAQSVAGKQIIATGITPSGNIHIGNMREVVTADAVLKAIKDAGKEARLIYVADTFDPLRTVYPFLPDVYKKYVGRPLSEIPDPVGCCESYAEHYLKPFLESLEDLGIEPEIFRADKMYKNGAYTAAIKLALEKRDIVAKIIEEVSGRKLPPGWSPFNPLCGSCKRITAGVVLAHQSDISSVKYRCACGGDGIANYSKGEGKLAWRIDWAARWSILGVTIEPFGKDHAVAGGSYDTGVRISREVYEHEPPRPIPYGHIHLKGKGKMSSSKGVTVTINEMLDIVPPDVLRYMIIKTKPEKLIDFDPGLGLLTLVDEFDSGKGRAYELSHVEGAKSSIPFRHMVTAVQIAHNFDQLIEVLKRGGYNVRDTNSIRMRAKNAKNWLQRFAPPFVKFTVQDYVPVQVQSLTTEQKDVLSLLAEVMEAGRDSAEQLHNAVYDISEHVGINPKDAFKAIYIALLGTSLGPRAGWFLASLDKEFVIYRLKEAAQV